MRSVVWRLYYRGRDKSDGSVELQYGLHKLGFLHQTHPRLAEPLSLQPVLDSRAGPGERLQPTGGGEAAQSLLHLQPAELGRLLPGAGPGDPGRAVSQHQHTSGYRHLPSHSETGELSSLQTMLSRGKFSKNKDVKKLSRTSQFFRCIPHTSHNTNRALLCTVASLNINKNAKSALPHFLPASTAFPLGKILTRE